MKRARKFTGTKLVVASHNSGKVREIRALLEEFGVTPVSAGDMGLPEPLKTGKPSLQMPRLKLSRQQGQQILLV